MVDGLSGGETIGWETIGWETIVGSEVERGCRGRRVASENAVKDRPLGILALPFIVQSRIVVVCDDSRKKVAKRRLEKQGSFTY